MSTDSAAKVSSTSSRSYHAEEFPPHFERAGSGPKTSTMVQPDVALVRHEFDPQLGQVFPLEVKAHKNVEDKVGEMNINISPMTDVAALLSLFVQPVPGDQIVAVGVSLAFSATTTGNISDGKNLFTGELTDFETFNLALLCLADKESLFFVMSDGTMRTFAPVLRPTVFTVNDNGNRMMTYRTQGPGFIPVTPRYRSVAARLISKILHEVQFSSGTSSEGGTKRVFTLDKNIVMFLVGLGRTKLYRIRLVKPGGGLVYDHYTDMGMATMNLGSRKIMCAYLHGRLLNMSPVDFFADFVQVMMSVIVSCELYAVHNNIDGITPVLNPESGSSSARLMFEVANASVRKHGGYALVLGSLVPHMLPRSIADSGITIRADLTLVQFGVQGRNADKLKAMNFLLKVLGTDGSYSIARSGNISPVYGRLALDLMSVYGFTNGGYDAHLINPMFAGGMLGHLLRPEIQVTIRRSDFYQRRANVLSYQLIDMRGSEFGGNFNNLLSELYDAVEREYVKEKPLEVDRAFGSMP